MSLNHDLRYAFRVLSRNRAFTIVALATLALGIGANTAIFSVVNAVLLRSLPYEKPEQLVRIYESSPDKRFPRFSLSYPDFADWKEQNQVFEDIACWFNSTTSLTGVGEPERFSLGHASASFFTLMGVRPLQGRLFVNEDGGPSSELVVILTHGLWQRRFGSDPAVIGQTLSLDSNQYTVIGVLPPEFQLYGQGGDLWTPIRIASLPESFRNRGNRVFSAVGRLKPGVSVKQAQSDMGAIAGRLQEQYPKSNEGWGVNVFSLNYDVTREIRQVLLIIFVAGLVVLAIACVNVVNLQLSRIASRDREVSVRAALGARRSHLIKQLLAESVVLSVMGGLLGIAVVYWGLDLLVKFIPPNKIARLSEVSIDYKVFGFTLLISVTVGVIFGLYPALKSSRPNLSASLKEGGRGAVGESSGRGLRRFLVVSEMALALILIICAGLVLKSFLRLVNTDPGFKADNVLTMQVSLPTLRYREPERVTTFYRELLGRVRAQPAVSAAAVSNILPLVSGGILTPILLEENFNAGQTEGTTIAVDTVTPDYFKTMGITLINGRDFKEEEETPAILVNQAAAKSFWPGQDPVGKRVRFSANDTLGSAVIGVVGDVRSSGLEDAPKPQLYVAFNDNTIRSATLIVRSNVEPASILPTIKNTIWSMDGDLPIYNNRPLEDVVAASVAPQRFSMILLVMFAIVALILAAVGIYGVMSYSVAQRTHEIGVRMALGARPADILKLILGEGMTLTAVGVVIGVVGAVLLTPVMSSLLYGIRAVDVTTFIAVTVLFGAIALIACYIPTRRAMRVDPMIAIRYE